VSDFLARHLAFAVVVALFFFTPRKGRGKPSYPANGGTKAVGVLLLVAVLVSAALQIVGRELGVVTR
jgi:hypothetical protein